MSKPIALAKYYQHNFSPFCYDLLKIRLEEGGIDRLELNDTQRQLTSLLDAQLSRTGKVRAIILKPRREGLSTVIGARFYHKTIFKQAIDTYILTHEQDATNKLFGMVKLFNDKLPSELRPATDQDSAKSLRFTHSLSGYSLGTAGNKAGGRSGLAHLFHGSEVAYWPDAEEVASSTLEIVGDEPGTEIVLESTGAPGTYYQETWDKAVSGDSEYIPIFFPWYESARNQKCADGLIIRPEEKELLKTYPGMTVENLQFRRTKLSTMSEVKFAREYPATPADAFMVDDKNAYISPEIVVRAAHRTHRENPSWNRILGVDPSQTADGDPCGMAIRHGNRITKLAKFRRERLQDRAHVIWRYIVDHGIDHTFIDQGGSGKEIYDLLIEWGLPPSSITIIPFGMKASNKKLYPNKRVEMYAGLRHWLEEEGRIPNDPEFIAELSLTQAVIDNNGQERLQSKKEMRKSPNLADAAALTFAFPVKQKR